MTIRETRRWGGIVAISLFAGAVGLLSQRSAVLLLAVIGVGYAAYPRIISQPPTPDLGVERTIDPTAPTADDTVEVTVSVTNEGDRWLSDLRIVDGVPTLLSVEGGTPRHATTLAPGDSATFEYELKARFGRHRFEPMTVLNRNLSGSVERRTSHMEPTVVDCTATDSGSSTPLRRITGFVSGQEVTDTGGDGIEFHRTREYRAGDPRNRIDWRRVAKTGELSTIEFREERAASVVLCLDTRSEHSADGVAYSAIAADRLAMGLLSDAHEVGITAFDAPSSWVPPGVGSGHLTRIRHALDTEPAFGTPAVRSVADGGQRRSSVTERSPASVDTLRRRLGPNTQVVFLSPLLDDEIANTARTLEATGHPVVVVSPDVTGRETIGQRSAALERASRLRRLREAGIPVIDWNVDSNIETALGGIR